MRVQKEGEQEEGRRRAVLGLWGGCGRVYIRAVAGRAKLRLVPPANGVAPSRSPGKCCRTIVLGLLVLPSEGLEDVGFEQGLLLMSSYRSC